MPAKLYGAVSDAPSVSSKVYTLEEMSAPLVSTEPSTLSKTTTTPTQSPKRALPSRSPSARKRPPSGSRGLARPKTSSPPPIDTLQIRNDRLGTLVRELAVAYTEAPSWESFVHEFRGRSYLSPELDNIDHPAAELLREWRDHGVPANTESLPWTEAQKDECIRRGCHQSALEHSDFLREEMAEFIENRFWTVLPYELVRAGAWSR